jgi:hypothetical protein
MTRISVVVPAKRPRTCSGGARAGTHDHPRVGSAQAVAMGPRLRGDDEVDWNPQ